MRKLTKLADLHKEFCDMQEHIRGLRPTTINSYKEAFRVFLDLTSKELTADRLTPELMTMFFSKLNTRERSFGKGTKSGIKASTKQTYYSRLNAFFKWLHWRRCIDISPFDGINIPKVKYEDIRYLTKEEVEKIFVAVTVNINWQNKLICKRNIAIFYILLFTGIRKGELLNLRIIDIDFTGNVLVVQGETSKSKDSRMIPLNDRVVKAVKDYLNERKWSNNPYLLISERGERFTECGIKHMVSKVIKTSGVKFHSHRFRHTFAMNMVNMGIDVARLQYLMGHKDIRQTSVYLRKMPSKMVKNTVEFLDFNDLV